MKKFTIPSALFLSCIAANFVWHRFDPLSAITSFQVAFLLLLLLLNYDWKALVAYDRIQSKLIALGDPVARVTQPPATIAWPSVTFPASAALSDTTVLKYCDVSASHRETLKYGETLEDQMHKMLYNAAGGGGIIILLRVVEQTIVPSSADQNIADLLKGIFLLKFVAATLPIILQITLLWGTCLYLRKRNRELAL